MSLIRGRQSVHTSYQRTWLFFLSRRRSHRHAGLMSRDALMSTAWLVGLQPAYEWPRNSQRKSHQGSGCLRSTPMERGLTVGDNVPLLFVVPLISVFLYRSLPPNLRVCSCYFLILSSLTLLSLHIITIVKTHRHHTLAPGLHHKRIYHQCRLLGTLLGPPVLYNKVNVHVLFCTAF